MTPLAQIVEVNGAPGRPSQTTFALEAPKPEPSIQPQSHQSMPMDYLFYLVVFAVAFGSGIYGGWIIWGARVRELNRMLHGEPLPVDHTTRAPWQRSCRPQQDYQEGFLG